MAEFKATGINGDYMIYKDRPLVRKDNMYCYGDLSDEYVMNIMVLTTKTVDFGGEAGKDIPDQVLVQIVSTDESKSPTERLVKQFDKNGLYDALDIGLIWLEKLNKKAD